MAGIYTLKEIQVRFGVAQHVLIHLCEKDVIEAEISETDGRGRWREFSRKNLFEFAVALEIRKFDIPVAKTRAIIKILSIFEKAMKKAAKDFTLPDSLGKGPTVKFYLFDGRNVVFSLGSKSFISFDIERLIKSDTTRVQPEKLSKLPSGFHSHLEVNLSDIANHL